MTRKAAVRGRRVRVLALTAATGMAVAALTAAMPAPAGNGNPPPAALRAIRAARRVPVHAVPWRPARLPATRVWHRSAVTWPAPGSGIVAVTAPRPGSSRATAAAWGNAAMAGVTAGSARAGTVPVWVGPAVTGNQAAQAGTVKVTMESRRAAAAAGVDGVIFTLARAGGLAGAAAVHVSLDYSSFASADAGGYAQRLRLVELPACVLTTPQVPACRRGLPVASSNDVADGRLGADVTLPAASAATSASAPAAGGPAGAGLLVMAAQTAASGSAGNFAATPLADAGTWTAGGNSGAFTYSYPIAVPPVPGGLEPQISLNYDSQSLDGLTSSTNDQASWIGDGWEYDPGYIERDYQTCSQETSLPASEQTGDLCWTSDNETTLSLGGQTTTLVQDTATGKWHAQDDQGAEITYETGTGINGTHDDDYWVITEPDGTSYYFGESELPGYASGDTASDSAWTVPVYATASGQPCYKSTFSGSYCDQAWRWNLDYVTDSRGDAMALFYNTETNYYAADAGTTAPSTSGYTQAGVLSKIEYGLRAGSIYGANPAAEVTFTAPATRTDVPTGSTGDLACSSGATCNVQSPTFWGRYQLSTIATEALNGSTPEPADSWALLQDYPSNGDTTTPPALFLKSITETGKDGGSVPLPSVTFTPDGLANRAQTPQDLTDGYSLLTRFRISDVVNETGGTTEVTYDTVPTSCTSGNFPAPDSNTTLCYPDYWTPPGKTTLVEDWFNKYVVSAITQVSSEVTSQAVYTTYCYGASPGCMSGAAWHYDDNPLQKTSQRTWDQFQGFATVTTKTGVAPDPVTETVDTYFQGMNGDYQGAGQPVTSSSLSATVGGVTVSATDNSQWAGQAFTHTVYDGAGGATVSETITTLWTSAATATQTGLPSPLPSLQAFMTGTAKTQAFTALAAGGYREADSDYTHDSYGRVITDAEVPDLSDNGKPGDATEDTCTQTTYATNTSASVWIFDLPAEVTATSEPPAGCPVTLPPSQSALISDKTYYYDNLATLGAAPVHGLLTKTQEATADTNASPPVESWTTEASYTYDEYGRVTAATDADNHATATSYSPATGDEPVTVTQTSPGTVNAPAGLQTITTYDPVRELPVSVETPAGLLTSEAYDALGRLTAVWTPGHAEGTAPATDKFIYAVSDTGPTIVTADTITPTGGYNPSETLYDSLGRAVETQTQTPDGSTDVTDTAFNSDGWPQLDSSTYNTGGAPSAKLVDATSGEVPSQTGYDYDGAGRVTRQISYTFGNETWETDTAYGGNYTTVTPPTGGTAQTTYTNGDGLTSYIYQYDSSPPPASPPAPGSGTKTGSWDQTAYTYYPSQALDTITSSSGSQWSYAYNDAGQQTTADSPDAGTTTSAYDNDGNLTSATTPDGTVSWTYDADDRQQAEYNTTGGAQETSSDELAAWTYDTLAKGQLTSSESFTGGTSGSGYTQQVLGYNAYGLPTGTETIIPSSAGTLAGTYKQGLSYNSYDDLESSYYDYAAGGLPAETVDLGYDSSADPTSLASSLWSYVPALSYTELGQPQEYALGTTASPAWINDTYNQQTGQLVSATTTAGTTPATVDSSSYGYNNNGDITSQAETGLGGTEVQCYQYDYLGRLNQNWTQAAVTSPSQPCATNAAASDVGGPWGYWKQLTYNPAGGVTADDGTFGSPGSQSTVDVTSTYGGAGSTGPDQLTGQTVSSSSYGTWTNTAAYNNAGQLITSDNASSGDLQLTWGGTGRDPGQLTAATVNGGTPTTYVYDASGSLLLQTDGNTSTLYLPDEQIASTSGTLSATRYYTIGGTTVAARTSAGTLDYLIGNQQGTDDVEINATTLAATQRYYDPWGNSTEFSPPAFPGNKGFVGGTTDPVTSLTNLGAREYDPATGQFISPDPELTPDDPQDLNPYAYAEDDPVSQADPTGLHACGEGDGSTGCEYVPPPNTPPTPNNTCPSSEPGCTGYQPPSGNDTGSGSSNTPAPRTVIAPIVGMAPINPFSPSGQQVSINDILNDPSLLTGQTPEALLTQLGWTGGAPSGWAIERLGKGNNQGLGMMLRQYTENGNPTGTFLRWYPGSSRPGHTNPNWKVANNQTGRDNGPDDDGYTTPQSNYWNQPGTPEEILGQMNGETPPSAGPTDGGLDDGGLDDGGQCACGDPVPEWFGGGGNDDELPIGILD
jgi:RHS repeat-associated protein